MFAIGMHRMCYSLAFLLFSHAGISSENIEVYQIEKEVGQFPPRSPSGSVSEAIHLTHASFVCLTESIIGLSFSEGLDGETRVELTLKDSTCATKGTQISFIREEIHGGYELFRLENPLDSILIPNAYQEARLGLSLIDSRDRKPKNGAYFAPDVKFRMELSHKYSYDSGRYGQLIVFYNSREGWKSVSNEIINEEIIYLPPGCDPRFPEIECRVVERTYSETLRHNQTGEVLTRTYTR